MAFFKTIVRNKENIVGVKVEIGRLSLLYLANMQLGSRIALRILAHQNSFISTKRFCWLLRPGPMPAAE